SKGKNTVDCDDSDEEEAEVNLEAKLVCALEESKLCRRKNQKKICTLKYYEEKICILEKRQTLREEEEANELK
ncbi:hypothetical protein KI387_044373, partial [Taxus chinensis]